MTDRLSIDFSLDGSGPLTRSLHDATTSGMIREDAAHWSIESFIPLEPVTLVEYLLSRNELDDMAKQRLIAFSDEIDRILHRRSSSYHTRFSKLYGLLDPDSDSRDPLDRNERDSKRKISLPSSPLDPTNLDPAEPHDADSGIEDSDATVSAEEEAHQLAKLARANEVITMMETVLGLAGYDTLDQSQIEQCAGVASHWSVPLHVDFNLFAELRIYARGDIIGTRMRRRIRNLYRPESVAVPIYQRMVVMFQLRDDDLSDEKLTASGLHLRMFKNIPKQDIDMLLPGIRVRISGVDHAKIILPSLGGFLMSIRKIAQYALLFAALALHWTAILTGLLLGYLVKSVLSYFQTKKRYQLNLTRNLYFQKLDTNAGTAYRLIHQAHDQSAVEAIIAYYGILSNEDAIGSRRLRRRCERIIREAIDVEVDFQIDRALDHLLECEAIEKIGEDFTVRHPSQLAQESTQS